LTVERLWIEPATFGSMGQWLPYATPKFHRGGEGVPHSIITQLITPSRTWCRVICNIERENS